jgi:Fe-S-cluster containining protein
MLSGWSRPGVDALKKPMSPAGKRKPFPRDGIRFSCLGCGRCCLSRGEYGYVHLSLEDRRRLAVHLGISTVAFTKKYAEHIDGWFYLCQPERDCPFLSEGRCGVYEARPRQCRTWPFWRENMTPRVWKREIAPYCPGVGRGRLYSAEEIESIIEKGDSTRD